MVHWEEQHQFLQPSVGMVQGLAKNNVLREFFWQPQTGLAIREMVDQGILIGNAGRPGQTLRRFPVFGEAD